MRKAWNVAITVIALALIAAVPMIAKAPGSRLTAQQPANGPGAPTQEPEPPVAPKPPVAPQPDPEPEPPAPPAAARPVGIDVPITAPRVLTSDRAMVENAWQDQVDGVWVQVFAGCIPSNQTQGVVWVVEEQPDGSQKLHAYRTPAAVGCVRIVAADGTQLTLKAGAQAIVFDVATQEFQA